MLNVLLWNLHRRSLEPLVTELADEHNLDLILLIEPPATWGHIISKASGTPWNRFASHRRFCVLAHAGVELELLSPLAPTSRVNFWRVPRSSGLDLLLVLVHGKDRRNYDDGTRSLDFSQIKSEVRHFERRYGHHRTCVVGDFNANPFEVAMASVLGLHALGVRSFSGESERVIGGGTHDFFYNPMWRRFGHGSDSASATYYHKGYNALELGWHMLDQVVLRSDLLPYFDELTLRILSSTRTVKMVDEFGHPDSRAASDHLPILFTLNI
ncbi:MAG TPA: hypothetical protein VL096_13980 [Pirellulaceae bacterium]|nr:hypothetical protein [Pirellulaceae bacterium]